MPANVEIKAYLPDPATTRDRAIALATEAPRLIQQVDTFFHCPQGRLKLRQFADGTGELIAYERPDGLAPAESSYVLSPTHDPERLIECLSQAMGLRGVVTKTRELIMIGQTRVHLDEVESLGAFLELEVVLRDNQPQAEGEAIARELMCQLAIADNDLIACAYIDLIEQRTDRTDG